ncbi:hypothetical protein [Actinomadura sp. 3N407]|uniref:hypothetical protein n=1 Tax=Actinomadura sp. 3N407 TaxID=3457423 RepID=UPI003FCC7A78
MVSSGAVASRLAAKGYVTREVDPDNRRTVVDSFDWPSTCMCSYTEPVGARTLDGNGISTVTIYVRDRAHKIIGYAECNRTASSCITGQT